MGDPVPPEEWVTNIRLFSDRWRQAREQASSAAKARSILIARLHRMGYGYGSIAEGLNITKGRAQQLVAQGERHLTEENVIGTRPRRRAWCAGRSRDSPVERP